jgi:hypothetical protein
MVDRESDGAKEGLREAGRQALTWIRCAFPPLLWSEAKISAPLRMICANVGMLDGLFPLR